jgi:hypothetical protein
MQRTSLEEDERPQTRPVVHRHPGDTQNQTAVITYSGPVGNSFILHNQQIIG